MNITLIGMPGVGKSIVGKELAKRLNFNFLDVDEIIEKNNKMKLQQIIDKFGDDKFLQIEERAILNLGELKNFVISPGGSVVYSVKAMQFLKKNSIVVFLSTSFENIKNQTQNQSTRGIVGLKKNGLKALFNERVPLYKKYADITIERENLDIDYIVGTIIKIIFPNLPSNLK